jgi:Tfp pilus assembly protein PilX
MSTQEAKGAASIPLVLGIGILVFLIAMSVTSVETARIYLTQANTDGAQALQYAESGVRDALLQLARNRDVGTSTPISFEIEMATSGCSTLRACARVAVNNGEGTESSPRIVSALGYYRNARKGLEAKVVFDVSGWGALRVLSLSETINPLGL